MSDANLQRLRRALANEPWDVQLQHATFAATLRAGELPERAHAHFAPLIAAGRPIQPWQWVPVSYLLLEAEEIGRHTAWHAGKLEVEWSATGPIPAWGLDAIPILVDTDEDLGRVLRGEPPLLGWRDRPIVEHSLRRASGQQSRGGGRPEVARHFPHDKYTKLFVGTSPLEYTSAHVVAGITPASVRELENERGRAHAAPHFFPTAHIPCLTDREAIKVKVADCQARSGNVPGSDVRYTTHTTYVHTRVSEEGGEYDCSALPPPNTGSYPDIYEPLLALRGFARVTTRSTRVGVPRRVAGLGPLLDVRLIRRARIMQRSKRGWI